MRVLIIDDDEQMRLILSRVVALLGYEICLATNGLEGVRIQREKPADLVITDLIMPEQEGLETIAILKRDFPATKIIAVSGGGRIGPEAYLPTAKELGADRVFSKPFEIHEIISAIKELVGHDPSSDACC
jgi:CheY-like chemotaxis protein